jgi:hypothetical protein
MGFTARILWDSYSTPTNRVISDLDFIDDRYWVTASGYGIFSSEDGVSWTTESAHFPADIYQLEKGGDRWVATGYGRRLWSSTNGTDWVSFEAVELPAPGFITCAYGNGRFVAGGTGAYGIWSSTDGLEWSTHGDPFGSDVNRIRFLNGLFVAVGPEGRIITSSDGLEWTRRDSKTSQSFYGVTYGAGKYLAVGGQGVIAESPDAINWTVQPVVLPDQFNDAAYVGGRFVLIGVSGGSLTSTDGRSWTSPNPAGYNFLDAVAAGPQGWVAVGNLGIILTSPDGRTWERRDSGTTQHLQGVVMTDDLIVVVGAEGTVLTSSDGVAWTQRESGTTRDLNSVIYANGQFMTGGPMAASTNGIDWAVARDNYPQTREITYGQGLWVAANHGSQLLTSPDGVDWATRSNGADNAAIIASPERFVSGGDNVLSISTNGLTWFRQTLPVDVGIRGLAYGCGHYLAVGSAGEILVSTNASDWVLASSSTRRFLRAAAAKDGVFIVVGANGMILRAAVEDETILTRERLAAGDGFEFRFTSTPGRTYLLQTSGDLKDWTDWQEVNADSAFTTVKDATATDGRRHYRVVPR